MKRFTGITVVNKSLEFVQLNSGRVVGWDRVRLDPTGDSMEWIYIHNGKVVSKEIGLNWYG